MILSIRGEHNIAGERHRAEAWHDGQEVSLMHLGVVPFPVLLPVPNAFADQSQQNRGSSDGGFQWKEGKKHSTKKKKQKVI